MDVDVYKESIGNNYDSKRTENIFKIREMKNKQRTLHDEVRVVYRACRRIYGVEKTQDECLRIFKIVFPEIYRLQESENERETLNENIRPALTAIIKSWQPQKKLKALCDKMDNYIGIPFDYDRLELISLLEDITPVAMKIRKLTPAECFRLMDVDDEDIKKIQDSGLSKSSQYKLAGNSIVVSVLYHCFRKLLIEPEPDYQPGEQLKLF